MWLTPEPGLRAQAPQAGWPPPRSPGLCVLTRKGESMRLSQTRAACVSGPSSQ